jgi:uncharacterized DUF497 family protein
VSYEWDPAKAQANFEKHRIRFADAAMTLEDDLALTVRDPFAEDEDRWITLGKDAAGYSLWFTPGEESVRAWFQHVQQCRVRRVNTRSIMKREYDFSKAKRGAVVAVPKGKTRITIRLDDEILACFRDQVERAGGGDQSVINEVLRQHVQQGREPLEKIIRRVIREELTRAS